MISAQSGSSPTITLDVPDDFHPVPLEASVQARTESQLAVLDAMGLDDRAQREALSLYLEALAGRLRSGAVASTAFCAVQVAGHASTATLTVAVHPTHTADSRLAALGAGEALRRDGRYEQVTLVQLGRQLAVTAITERAAVAGGDDASAAPDRHREFCVMVPVAGHEHAAMLTVSTPIREDWDLYRTVALDIARSLRVGSPLSAEPDRVG